MKTIAFDGKRAVLNYTGIGNYSRLAIESLLPLLPTDTHLDLYTPRIKENPRLAPLLANQRVSLRTPDTLAGRLLPQLWRSNGLTAQLRRDRPALYHGLSNELPLGIERSGIPSVVTIHDLIFERHPEFYHAPDVAICRKKFRYAAEAADRVIAISRRTADDLQELYGIPGDKIRIVYQGCSPLFFRTPSPEAVAKHQRRFGTYIIGVGTIESRKNQLLTLHALAQLPSDVNLVLVGRQTAYAKRIAAEARKLGLSNRLTMLSGVTMAQIPALYAGATIAAYPSFYEGFGIPMLEALACGTPLVAATGSCLEEAGGPGALYVDPTDVDAFAAAARRLLDSSSLRQEMVHRGQQYITRFAPEKFGQGLVNVYNELL